MNPRVAGLWYAFLILWAAALFCFGAVRPWAIAATAFGTSLLYGLSLLLIPEPPRLSRPALCFLGGLALLVLLQAAPLPFLVPHATRLRETHGVGSFWPATADAFLSVRTAAQLAAYVCTGLLLLRLRQAGLSTSSALRGLLLVAGAEAAWGVIRVLGGIDWMPFYDGPRGDPGSASGHLVNRNNFAGLCGMGLLLAGGLAAARFTWPPRRSEDERTSTARRLEAGLGWALLASLFATALLLSKSRGGVLAALAGLGVLPFLHRGRAGGMGLLALVAAAVVAFVAANPSGLLQRFEAMDPFEVSSESRWTIWTLTASAAAVQPLLGFGIGTHPHAFHPFQPPSLAGQVQHAHNEYVNVLFEAGAVGLLFTLAALAVWLIRAWRGLRLLHSPDRLPAAGAVAAAVVVLVHSLVDFDLRITGVGLMWAALAGLGASLSRDGGAAKATSWTAAAAGLGIAALLAFAPLKSLGLTPYDHALAWEAARASGDPAKFETAAALFPAHPALQREAGLGFWEHGDLKRAGVCFRRLFEQKPEEVDTVLAEIHDPARPPSDYEALLPGTPEAAARLAAFLLRSGDWAGAMGVFERGRGASAPAHDFFAAALQQAGQWGLEARVRDLRLEAASDGWAHAAAAEAWRRLGVWDRALERALTAERIEPSNAAWSALKGEILLAKGDGLSALEALTEASRKAPAELNYRLRRAELALGERTFQAAADDFREVLRSRPGERRALLGLARALLGLGQKDAARVLLDEWLARNPKDVEAERLRATAR